MREKTRQWPNKTLGAIGIVVLAFTVILHGGCGYNVPRPDENTVKMALDNIPLPEGYELIWDRGPIPEGGKGGFYGGRTWSWDRMYLVPDSAQQAEDDVNSELERLWKETGTPYRDGIVGEKVEGADIHVSVEKQMPAGTNGPTRLQDRYPDQVLVTFRLDWR